MLCSSPIRTPVSSSVRIASRFRWNLQQPTSAVISRAVSTRGNGVAPGRDGSLRIGDGRPYSSSTKRKKARQHFTRDRRDSRLRLPSIRAGSSTSRVVGNRSSKARILLNAQLYCAMPGAFTPTASLTVMNLSIATSNASWLMGFMVDTSPESDIDTLLFKARHYGDPIPTT